MAHFAKIGKGNIVEKVVVVHNNVATTEQTGEIGRASCRERV